MNIVLTYVDPKGISWNDFCDSVVSYTPDLSPLLPNVDEKYWRLWAEALSSLSEIPVTPPDNQDYTNWREWATDLMAPY